MYQIVGCRPDGTRVDLFTWNGHPKAGIDRAKRDATEFEKSFDRYEALTLDPE